MTNIQDFEEEVREDQPTENNRPFTINVSERVKRLPPYLFAELNNLKYQKRCAGDDVIDLGMGSPSDPPHKVIIDKLCEAANDPKLHSYSHAKGMFKLRREVCLRYARKFGVTLDPETQVVTCLGSKEGFSHMCLALLGHGDTAIVPAPSYPAHMYAVALTGANEILFDVTDRKSTRLNSSH